MQPDSCNHLFSPAQGDFFTVEDLAYDYPTLNTL